ncbi:NAD(P)-binding domain protein, partial [Metarhizium majus ARSEF 297]
MPKLLDFRCAVITGGGGGIGKAMARHLVSKGKTVLLAGRTESNLQSAARDVGAAGYYLLDVGKTADMSPFVGRITREHPRARLPDQQRRRPAAPGYPQGRRLCRQGRPGNRHQRPGTYAPDARAAAASADQAQRRYYQRCRAFWALSPFPSFNPVYNGTKAWRHF